MKIQSKFKFVQETRRRLFNDYMDHGEDFAKVAAIFEQRLEESQRTTVKYGFRNDQWLKKHHGESKAAKIMERKKALGLNLGSLLFITTNPVHKHPIQSRPHHIEDIAPPIDHCSYPRTIQDPEFPGDEEEKLFFVLVEFNVEDIKELRRITALELKGELDADGVKAFVEVSWFIMKNIKCIFKPPRFSWQSFKVIPNPKCNYNILEWIVNLFQIMWTNLGWRLP